MGKGWGNWLENQACPATKKLLLFSWDGNLTSTDAVRNVTLLLQFVQISHKLFEIGKATISVERRNLPDR